MTFDGWTFADGEGARDALAGFLRSLPARPRLLALGEPAHGVEDFLRLRNEFFRHLAEHEGYRSVAVESDCLKGLTVDAYVADGVGSLDEVMRDGFSPGFEGSAAGRELVRWMREHNQGLPAGERLRFAGFDGPLEMSGAASPRQALIALHRYLSAHLEAGLVPYAIDAVETLIGDEEPWSSQAALLDPAQSVGFARPADVAELRLIADDLRTLLTAHTPALVAATSLDDWRRARLYARTAAGLLRYHAAMGDTTTARLPRLMRLRDTMMADNLDALLADGPVMVFAHNSHLQRARSHWRLAGQDLDWWSAGAIVAARLGDRYAFLATAVGAAPRWGLGAPEPGTVEAVLDTLPESRLVRTDRLTAELGESAPAMRTGDFTRQGYFPLDPGLLGGSDGIVFLKRLTGEHPA
ncbi:erythromycin esterase family protein [Nonomuraea rhizosphaerae]|uniref:erythromycin esterase family protein n=1 Tax=Nonomuraea rhizosphaerae TaxID=2665663 RepID=UPI001C5D0E91|nr:erythromycin esterase family protein [Nonomuraea rhizosphaerae]